MLLSIIVPVYNGEKYIKRCVDAILLHRNKDNVEVIIIDDGSNDSTQDILKCYTLETNVQIVSIPNAGVSNARNIGLKIAKGIYIFFCDADDFISPTFFEVIFPFMKQNVDILSFGYYTTSERGDSLRINCLEKTKSFTNRDFAKQILIDERVGGFVWNKIYRREIVRNLFQKELSICEDLYFNIQNLCDNKSLNILCLSSPLYSYSSIYDSASRRLNNLFTDDNRFKYSVTFNKLSDICGSTLIKEVRAKLFLCALSVNLKNTISRTLNKEQLNVLHKEMRRCYSFFLKSESISFVWKFKYTLFYLFPVLKHVSEIRQHILSKHQQKKN